MADPAELARTGVCVVRIEVNGSAGLLITVSGRLDVNRDTDQFVLTTVTVDDAVVEVRRFLTGFL